MSERKYYIYAAKALAVLLVLNSHMDSIYPVSALAAGGALGNALFFFVSGYTWSNIHNKSFGQWYIGKFKRIYVPTIITNIIYILIFDMLHLSLKNYFNLFVYPNKSWFCGAILLYALFYYFIAKKGDVKYIKLSLLSVTALYAVYYIIFLDKSAFNVESMQSGGLCRVMFYAACMLAGLLYKKEESDTEKGGRVLLPGVLAIGLFAATFALKFFMNRFPVLLSFQFICQVMTVASAFFFFVTLRNAEPLLKKASWNKIIVVIANYSWEIYLVQTLIIPKCSALMFPLNSLLAVLLIIIASKALKMLTDFLLGLKLPVRQGEE